MDMKSNYCTRSSDEALRDARDISARPQMQLSRLRTTRSASKRHPKSFQAGSKDERTVPFGYATGVKVSFDPGTLGPSSKQGHP